MITCLLTELDGLLSKKSGDGVFLLATTSRKELLDPAILRPGRIGIHLQMPDFDEDGRRTFLRGKMGKMPIQINDEEVEEIVTLVAGLTPADLEGILREAALYALRVGATTVKMDSIKGAIARRGNWGLA